MFIGLLGACAIECLDESLIFISEGHIICVFLNNQPCQVRPTLVEAHPNETLFYPFTVSFNKCGGSCNTLDYPYARVYVPNKVKKIFKKWNHDECRCECEELDD